MEPIFLRKPAEEVRHKSQSLAEIEQHKAVFFAKGGVVHQCGHGEINFTPKVDDKGRIGININPKGKNSERSK